MSIDPQPIKITLDTNIPGKSEVTFTSNMLYQPDPEITLTYESKYPYMIDNAILPDISGLDYAKIIKIFFNLDAFKNEFNPRTNDNIVFRGDPKSNMEQNINMMLMAIFPTKPLAIKYNHQSIDKLLEKSPQTSMFYNPVKTRFSYLKIDNKPYTIVKSIWLNDIVNHPKYKQLLKDVHNAIISNNTSLQDLTQKIKVEVRKVISNCDEITKNISEKHNNDEYKVAEWKPLIVLFFIKTYLTDLTKTPQNIIGKIQKNTNQEVKIGDKLLRVNRNRQTNVDDRLNEVTGPILAIIVEDTDDIVKRFEQINNLLNVDEIKSLFETDSIFYDEETDKNSDTIKWNLINDYKNTGIDVITPKAKEYINNVVIPKFKSETFDSRTSSNIILQDVLDESDDKTIEKLEDVYKRFELNDKDQKYDKDIVNLSIDRINRNARNSNEPKREIFVFLDLVDGEINESNKKEVIRHYKGDFLGNFLTKLLSSNDHNQTVKHFPIYSIKTKQSSDVKKKESGALPNPNIKNNNKPEDKSDEPNNELINNFNNAIKDNKNIPQIIGDLRSSSNKISKPITIDVQNLLPFIRDSKKIVSSDYSQIDLYKLIQKWGSIQIRDTRSLDQMKRRIKDELEQLKQTINTRIEQNKNEIQIVDKINPQNKIDKLNNLNNYFKLYNEIVSDLIKDITPPKPVIGGKSTKTRRKSKLRQCANNKTNKIKRKSMQ